MERPSFRGDQAPRYQTFLLTCWQERDEVTGTVTWRFKLETPQFGSRRLFLTLKEAMEAIEEELESK